jgi:hypothetical protein
MKPDESQQQESEPNGHEGLFVVARRFKEFVAWEHGDDNSSQPASGGLEPSMTTDQWYEADAQASDDGDQCFLMRAAFGGGATLNSVDLTEQPRVKRCQMCGWSGIGYEDIAKRSSPRDTAGSDFALGSARGFVVISPQVVDVLGTNNERQCEDSQVGNNPFHRTGSSCDFGLTEIVFD